MPEKVERALSAARTDAAQARAQALWEAEMARRALAPLGVPVILLKGTAYAAAGLGTAYAAAGQGAAEERSIGDLDTLVPREALPQVEQALLGAGWEWVKEGAYDDTDYRTWMHKLPPLIHQERDRMIDVHHTILPLTARRRPDAVAMVADSIPVESGLRILAPADMVAHAAAHLIADGDLAGGLRNLWDRDHMLRRPFRPARHGTSSSPRSAAPSAWRTTSTAPRSAGLEENAPCRPLSAAACSHATAGGGRPASPCASLSTAVRTGCGCRP